MSAKATVSVDPTSGPLEIDKDIEAMFPPAEAIASARWNINLIDAGAKGHVLSLRDKIVALSDHNCGFTFAVAVKTKPHSPTSNPLSLDERVG